MQDNEIIEQVLLHLQGYIVESNEEISDLDYDKEVSSEEVIAFYNVTYANALAYLNFTEFPTVTQTDSETDLEVEVIDPVIMTGLCMWTAGKLWNKYNVRVNNNEDDTTPFGYGDKLVIQAKELLKPFKYYKMMVY